MCLSRAAVALLLLLPAALHAQAPKATPPIVLEGADRRPATSLDGDWHVIVDPYFTGLYSFHNAERKDGFFENKPLPAPGDNTLVEYSFAKSPTLHVPGDWNTQRPDLFFYEGPLWYQRDFSYTAQPSHRVFLHVGAANYHSLFWINGTRVCEHEGGFTTFDCDATAALKPGANSIVAAVDNTRHPEDLPTLKTDWWNYGGLTRDISLIEVPDRYIQSYDLHLDRATRTKIEGWIQLAGSHEEHGRDVIVSIPELKISVHLGPDAAGRVPVSIPVPGLKPWTPEAPKLYQVDLTARPAKYAGAAQGLDRISDTLHEELGFKTIETRGSEILLNGKPIFLRGVSIHAEAPYRTGRANTDKDMDTLLGWAKDLGCNFVRLAHYPHDEKMTRAADRLGLLVWSEIPIYWAVEFDNPAVLAKAKHILHEEIDRDRNRASIALWSVANETPNTPVRTQFLTSLADEVRATDPTRLVTAALLVHNGPVGPDGKSHTKVIDDPLGKSLDVIGFNEYIGWYEGTPATADDTTWTVAYDKPLLVSEFGGGAKAGRHGPATERFTEEYQAAIFEHQLPMINKIPHLRGMSPWVLMDFRSPSRLLPGTQDYFNRKGLISDQGEKKKAFSVLQHAYQDGGIGHAQ